jgi:hypothetical protein
MPFRWIWSPSRPGNDAEDGDEGQDQRTQPETAYFPELTIQNRAPISMPPISLHSSLVGSRRHRIVCQSPQLVFPPRRQPGRTARMILPHFACCSVPACRSRWWRWCRPADPERPHGNQAKIKAYRPETAHFPSLKANSQSSSPHYSSKLCRSCNAID